eukprot:gnl/MRDRNA2_/MRDRNA2_30739_c0_seq1.p1 gnl/MRDRNA2_/MRDRNA2_30739_c0~~gnl/MRDRNA2_/MRDRNA2_30739_c0_seq1.p1  ORF type:complete len:306 (-),score=58.11 gnl/MRDRNA2_/MRDRNA2_30739_c0_seq1:86-1003(-)
MMRQLPRAAHWVIRCSDLKPALNFYKEVLGMVVIRHEENAEPCAITCNGRYNNAWSKTMVGWPQHYEDEWYCLEVTYNYGVLNYETDNALMAFGVCVDDIKVASEAAQRLGFKVSDGVIVGPDGYSFELFPKLRPEPFLYVKMRVSSIDAARAFYCGKLGMAEISQVFPYIDEAKKYCSSAKCAALSYPDGWSVPCLVVEDGQKPTWSSWTGRFAVSMPGDQIKEVYQTIDKANVVHELGDLQEKLGRLVITIVKDDDGFETCLVSSEFFDKATRSATDWKDPDFDQRRSFIDERCKPADKGKSS